jgi:ribonuclease Z
MDLSLFFAGTGGSVPSARRGLPAVLVRRGGDRLLFDCAEGTQRQLMRSVGLLDLDAVFITHFHADHWLGLPGMLKSFALRERQAPLTVYGPSGLGDLMKAMFIIYGRLPYELSIVELEPAERVELDGYEVAAIPVHHRGGPSFGYALVEQPRPGHLDPQLAEQLGVSPGPDFGLLQRGETVSGVRPEQVMSAPREGRKVVLSGDTAPCEALAIAAYQADVLREPDPALHRPPGGPARARRRGAAARPHARLEPIRRRRASRGGARGVRGHRGAAGLRHHRGALPRARRRQARALVGATGGPRGVRRGLRAVSRRPSRRRRGHRFSLIHFPCSFNPVP